MKVKITKPDGTVVEAEGTAEECERLVGAPQVNRESAPVPQFFPIKTYPVPMQPVYPGTSWPSDFWVGPVGPMWTGGSSGTDWFPRSGYFTV